MSGYRFFPEMARREVQHFLRRYRRVARRRHRLLVSVLHWRRPGSVWAIDFAEPPLAIEEVYNYLLAVRDLWLWPADEPAMVDEA
jgi:hypothetical protein